MIEKLIELLDEKLNKVKDGLYEAEDGLIRVSLSDKKDTIIVEFAEYGVEADNMLFDDVGLYPIEEGTIELILEDLELN